MGKIDRRQDMKLLIPPKTKPLPLETNDACVARLEHFNRRSLPDPHFLQPMHLFRAAENLPDSRFLPRRQKMERHQFHGSRIHSDGLR